ncbi:MAG: tRNA (adenosine(37)-N6)-threonylcarbamoyltransferase complex ATPase subunit type 1 TsaE [Candidatus Falkowbacteria bacterium]|nr:tRNA (adenosine(37)-N6)-threonylcarbamoyltransferase complex ATPase subunit type 1 TsaE [Candidatus Falkowbacteria bacterium]
MEKEKLNSTIILADATITHDYAFQLAQKILRAGEKNIIIGLIGDLGSGKTTFAQGFANGLGIKKISSPTFVLMKVYPINTKNKSEFKRFAHIDAYRLAGKSDILESIGATEYLKDNHTITLIEWADIIKKKLPKNTLFIKLKYYDNHQKRTLKIA